MMAYLNFKNIVNALIVVVLSSMFFEDGLYFFVNYWGITLNSISMAALFLVMIAGLCVRENKFRIESESSFLFLVIYIYWTYSVFNSIYSLSFEDALFSIVKNFWYLVFFTIMFLYFQEFDRGRVKRLLNVSGFVSFWALIYFMCHQAFTGEMLRPEGYVGKFTLSPFLDYNMYVLMLCFSLIAMFFDLDKTRFKVFLYFCLVLLVLLVAIVVGSRRSIVFYVPLIVLFSLSFLRVQNFLLIMIVGFFASASLLVLLHNSNYLESSMMEGVSERVDRALSVFDSGSNTSGTRITRWNDAVEILSGADFFQLVIGLGQRSFYAFPEYIRYDGGKDYPHNFILTAFFEGGIVKVFLIVFLISIYCVLAFQLPRRFSGYLLTFMGLWFLTALISGEEFFMSKQIYIPFVFLAIFYLHRRDGRV